MRDAAFSDGPALLLKPLTRIVECAGRAEVSCETARAAGIAARLAAGIMRCTSGVVFVGDFDPKIQPVQVKRLTGLVPHDPPRSPICADAYFRYRACLWGLDAVEAERRGTAYLRMLDGLPDAQALALAGALLHAPSLLVLDRPSRALRSAAEAVIDSEALFVIYGPGEAGALS